MLFRSVINMTIGALVKAVISYLLTSIPSINIKGAALGTVIGYAVAAFLNLFALIKYQGKGLNIISIALKPIIATSAMTIAAYYIYKFTYIYTLRNSLSTLISILLSAVIYGLIIILIGGIKEEELDMALGSKKLSRILKKRGLL